MIPPRYIIRKENVDFGMIPSYIRCIKVEYNSLDITFEHNSNVCLRKCTKLLSKKYISQLRCIVLRGDSPVMIDNNGNYTISHKKISDMWSSNSGRFNKSDRSFKLMKAVYTTTMDDYGCNKCDILMFKYIESARYGMNVSRILESISFAARKSLREIYLMMDTCEMYLSIYLKQKNKLDIIRKICMIYATKNLTKMICYFI